MRVCFVADSDAWGGAEVYLTHLLRRAGEHGVEAVLLCAPGVAGVFADRVGQAHRVSVPLSRHARDAPQLRAALAGLAPDVVHVNLVDPASNAAAVAAALDVAPTTATLHLVGDVDAGIGRDRLADLYARLALLISPSREGAQLVVSRLAEPRGGVHVVANGVDIPDDPHGPAHAWPVRVGAHGRLTAQKGYDVLLTAVATLVGRGHALEVVLGGVGRDEAALREASAGLPVRWTGFVADARAFLAGLDVFVLSSRRDALPLSLLEAMAEGLACVATDVGDVRSAVGDAVLVVPPQDPVALAGALEEVVGDPSRRAALGQAARARAAAHLSADLMARRTYALLREAPRCR